MPEKPPSLRARKARLTRDEILAAARRLFAERGYTRTSVRDIAEAAAVSVQTVYDSVGSKQAIVGQLNDLIDAEAGVGEIVAAAVRSGDPGQVAAVSAAVTRSILENCGDILHALVTGAAAEPDLQIALDEGHRRHTEGAAWAVGQLDQLEALGEQVDLATAPDVLAAISDFRFALMLRDSYGWSLDRIEAWIAGTSRALLLKPEPVDS